MKNIVGLLDAYRLALLEDPDYLLILAFLLRNRSASTEELAKNTGKSKAKVTALVRDLYRAGWVNTSSSDRLFLRSDRESFLDQFGLVDIAMDSLLRELTPSEYERAELRKSVAGLRAWSDKGRCLHSLHAASWTARFLPENDPSVWFRALRLLVGEAGAGRSLGTTASDEVEPADVDKHNLWVFWRDSKLPADAVSRDVTVCGAFLIVVFWTCYSWDSELKRSVAGSDPARFDLLWSEHAAKHQDRGEKLASVLSHCAPDFEAPKKGASLRELMADVLRRLGKPPQQSLESDNDIVCKLLQAAEKEIR